MAEYVEREALLKRLCSDACGCIDEDCANEVRCYSGKMIEEMPAADVGPVRHGKWIESFAGDYFTCSECKETEYKKSLYCPNCGAKMDGGARNG